MTSTDTTETGVLLRYLDAQRAHVLGILEGLDDEALRQAVLPSGWNALGLVNHLAIDVERFWFQGTVAANPAAIQETESASRAWSVPADVPAETIFARYREAIERANEIIAATPMDAPPAWWPADLFGDFRLDTVREIVLHVITETACHAGHLDAVRELIDGRIWFMMEE